MNEVAPGVCDELRKRRKKFGKLCLALHRKTHPGETFTAIHSNDIFKIFLAFPSDVCPKATMIQRTQIRYSQHLAGQSVVHLMEQSRHAHPFNMTPLRAAAKSAWSLHLTDNHIEGDFQSNDTDPYVID